MPRASRQATHSNPARHGPLSAALIGALLTVTVVARADRAPPPYQPHPCTFEGAAVLGARVECGALTVPEDRARTDGRTVQLQVAVLRASGPHRRPDPVVFLAGGPGGRGITGVEEWLARPFARDRDVVLFDQRGTGTSEPLCPAAARDVVRAMAADLGPREDVARNVAIARRCLDEMRRRGVDPTRYASAPSAADLDELRVALGYEQWNLLGVSYGTRLGLTAMRDHPQGVRSVVLDSTFPPAEDFYRTLAESYAPAVARLASECAASPQCRGSVGDLRAELAAFEARLAARPLVLHVDDPTHVPGGTFVANAQDVRFLVGEQLVFGATRTVLPAFVRAWRAGRTESLGELFRIAAQLFEGHDLGKYYAVQCTEEMPFSVATPAAPRAAFHDAAHAVCADWNLPRADRRENDPVDSDVPALLLAGQIDPRAPPDFARRALAHLTRGVLVEVPGAGHGVLGEGCAADVVTAFLDAPTRRPDAACLERRAAPAPLGAARVTSGPLRVFRAVRRGERTALLWLGGCLLVLLSALVAWPLRALWRARRRAREGVAHAARGGRRAAAAHVALWLGALGAWAYAVGLARAVLRTLAGPYALAIVLGVPGDAAALSVLPPLVLLATLAGGALGVLAWRDAAWTRAVRWHFALTAGAAAALLAFLTRYQLC